ncbi:MAG: Trk system potassium transporter TrkA [Clostridiales bacterium]|nr:Trk system potassium transporter TrkA [Clostridiales bacterium]
MKIIIVGSGKVGYSLAQSLSTEGNDVIMIDHDKESLDKAYNFLDVMCIKGNGLRSSTLIESGVKECDLLIAVTGSDEVNMVCCLTAKKLGAKHCVARIRDPEYADELLVLKEEIGVDMVINPEREAAAEIARIIKFPPAVNVEIFAKGRIEMVEIKVSKNLTICDLKLKEHKGNFYHSVLICAVQRGDEIYIPHGDFLIEGNDLLYIIGEHSKVYGYCREIGVDFYKIKSVMILGGGRLSYYLAKNLNEIGIKVKIIEISKQRGNELSELLPNVLIICGDGTEETLLHSESIQHMDAFVALAGRDEDNLITALVAKENGVRKCIAKINKIAHTNLLNKIGIDSIVSPKIVTANHIIRFARSLKNAIDNPVNTLYKLIDDKVEALEFVADSHTKFLDIPLKDINFVKNIMIAALLRKNNIIIPHGNDVIKERDSVILIAKDKTFSDLNEIFISTKSSDEKI